MSVVVVLLAVEGRVAASSGHPIGLVLNTTSGPDIRGIQTQLIVPRRSHRLDVERDRGEAESP